MNPMFVETLGWVATALLVVSVVQTKIAWLRIFAVLSSIAWVGYAFMSDAMPVLATNLILIVLHGYNLWKLRNATSEPSPESASTVTPHGSELAKA